MTTKKFIGDNTHAVMMQIREEFGRDAIVISNRKVDDGVEILASDSFEELSDQANKHAKKGVRSTNSSKTVQAASSVRVERSSGDLKRELTEMRNMLEGLANSGSAASGGNLAEMSLTGKLTATGLSNDLVQQLLDPSRPIKQASTAWKKIFLLLRKQIAVKTEDFSAANNIVVFHGMAGVGKTSALCKVATRFLVDHNATKLAIISVRQGNALNPRDGLLDAFSKLLSVPVLTLETEQDLSQALKSLRRKKLVLVDTEGLDEHVLLDPAMLVGATLSQRHIEHCLVVSASHQANTLNRVFGCLAESAVQSVIISRLDETRQPGIVIDSLIRSGLPVAYSSDSPGLHDPIRSDPAVQLLDLLREQDSPIMPETKLKLETKAHPRKRKARRRSTTIGNDSESDIIV